MSSVDKAALYQHNAYIDHEDETVLDGTLAVVVAQDKAITSIGLGTNVDLDHVESDLVFDSEGDFTSDITWDASAHTQITNAGLVAQGTINVTADIVATITKYTESDTKTFSVTVLAV